MGRVHLQAALENNLKIKVLFDVNQRLAAEIIDDFNLSGVSIANNINEFAELSSGHIIGIATTSPVHLQLITAVAKAGSTEIICEKPLLNSFSEVAKLNNLVTANRLRIAVNHQMRYMQQYTKILEWTEEFELGKLLSMSVSAANFGLGMNGTHYFEAFHWLTGDSLETISGWVAPQSTPNVRGSEFFDYAGTLIGFTTTGRKLFLDFPEDAGHQIVVVYNFELGKIIMNELLGEAWINVRNHESRLLPTFRYGLKNESHTRTVQSVDLTSTTSALYSDFLKNGDYPSWERGARAVICSLAAVLSSTRGGQPVNVSSVDLDTVGSLSWP
jgi:predicted dehydrogenase